MAEKKVIEIEIQDNTKSLKAQYREAVQEVQKLVQAYGETSQEVAEAAKRAAELKDQIEDTNDAIAAFKGEGVFNATGKAISSVASGFSAVEGAVALVGVESEALQETMVRLQAAMALAQGLEGLEDAERAFGQLKTVAVTAFQGMTTASKVFLATGIGLLIAGLGTMIAYWDDISEAIGVNNKYLTANTKAKELNQKETEKLNNELERQKALTSELTEMIDFQTRETLAKAKARGASERELNAIIINGIKRRIEVLKQNELEAQKEYLKMSKKGTREQYELAEKNWKEQLKLRKEAQLTLLELQSDYQSKALEKSKESNYIIDDNLLKQQQLDAENLRRLEEFTVGQNVKLETATDVTTGIIEQRTRELEHDIYVAEEQRRIDAETAQRRQRNVEFTAESIAQTFALIAQMTQANDKMSEKQARRAFNINKMAQIGQATATTYLSATKAYASQIIPGDPTSVVRGQVAAGLAIASGLANVAMIARQQFNAPSASGGGSMSASSGGGIVAPNLNVVGDTGINQLAQLGQTPIKAYVVSNDITTAQMFDLKVQQTASL